MALSHPLLQVDELSVEYRPPGRAPILALDRVSFRLESGEVLGVLGESGCGKSTLAAALMRLLPPAGQQIHGRLDFAGQRLDRLTERQLRHVRGAEMALIFQEPALALHPLKRVGTQLVDILAAHRPWRRKRCREVALDGLGAAGLPDPETISRAFPHQLSGGQRQRVAIALALACEPSLVIADEPTASLDAPLALRVLELFARRRQDSSMSWLLISHNPRVLRRLADRVLVLYSGRVIESGTVEQILRHPRHPYTRALLSAVPKLPPRAAVVDRPFLPVIEGEAQAVHASVPGCAFAARCRRREARCDTEAPWLRPVGDGRGSQEVACWFPEGAGVSGGTE